MSAPSLYTLPVELLHRILDNLDVRIILLSFRRVCKRFSSITSSYNRYNFDCRTNAKSDFHFVCRLIRPEHVTSLTISDARETPGQIGLFFSLFSIDQFTRLRSLTLIDIDRYHLDICLKNVSCCSLISLSVDMRGPFFHHTLLPAVLSSTIAQSSLRRFHLGMWFDDINELSWPVQCTIQHLSISNRIKFKHLCTIFRCSPRLQTLVLKYCFLEITSLIDVAPFQQLTSLTMTDDYMKIKDLESLLCLTPSLIYLKLIGSTDLSDGNRLEQFIERQLPVLEKFEFFFASRTNACYHVNDLDSLIAAFRSPFWLETKRWFVTCEYVLDPFYIRVYSIPVCNPSFEYESESNKISCSMSTMPNKDPTMMDSVHTLTINLTKVMNSNVLSKMNEVSNGHLFRKVKKLMLHVDGKWPIGSLDFLATVVDLSHLVQLSLKIKFDSDASFSNTAVSIAALLERAGSIDTLIISWHWPTKVYDIMINKLSIAVLRHVKYLHATVVTVDEMRFLLERFKHLSSVKFRFQYDLSTVSMNIIDLLKQKKRDFTYWKNNYSLQIWLDQSP